MRELSWQEWLDVEAMYCHEPTGDDRDDMRLEAMLLMLTGDMRSIEWPYYEQQDSMEGTPEQRKESFDEYVAVWGR